MLKEIDPKCKPTRGSELSACVDLYAREDMTIGAGETVLIPLGVKIDLDSFMKRQNFEQIDNEEGFSFFREEDWNKFKKSHYLQLMLRSSLSKELIIANGVGVVDLDYPDEIMIRVHNPIKNGFLFHIAQMIDDIKKKHFNCMILSNSKIIKAGDRIAQITLIEHKSHLFNITSKEKRSGGFGSTGRK
jgi:dUTPase